jgi:Transposase DDE domain group 1
LKVNDSRATQSMRVTTDGKNLVSHVGTALLSELADRSGLTEAMSSAMAACGINWHTHDPGVVLTHVAVAIADGADCLADMAALREQAELFGPVASIATGWRAVEATTSFELRSIPEAITAARAKVWAAAPPGDSLVLDFDATLVNAYSEKQDATPTYKKGFGFFPLGVWCDTTNEPPAAMLRPGRAGADDADDHTTLLDQALSGLPEEYQAGHFSEDDPALVAHPILVWADSAGATHGFVDSIVAANCDFSIGFSLDQGVRDALVLVQEEDWIQARETDGSIRDGAWVTELTGLMALTTWPEETRLIMRRERPHPGAQLTRFDTSEGFRHTCFITNTQGADIAPLELRHRGHARVEDRIRNWKDCGLANRPFDSFVRNEAWVATSLIAGARLAWSQMVCFDGALAKAEPKTMCYRVPWPPSSCKSPEVSSCAWMRPGHGWTTSPTPSSNCGQRSPDRVGQYARPESRPAGRDIRNRMTTPWHFTPTMRSGRQVRSPPSCQRLCRQPWVGRMIEINRRGQLFLLQAIGILS